MQIEGHGVHGYWDSVLSPGFVARGVGMVMTQRPAVNQWAPAKCLSLPMVPGTTRCAPSVRLSLVDSRMIALPGLFAV